MTRFHRLARGSALAAACACAFAVALAGFSGISEAKKKAPTPAQPSAPSAQGEQPGQAAHKAYDAGLKEFANGHFQPAIDNLSTALTAGGLTAPEMAKALYTRGIAYKKQGKPGLAISDLTSALWLKNGLTPSERDKATQDRADAFKMAGIEDSGKGPERVIGEASPAATSAPASNANLGPNSSSAGLSAAAIAQAASDGKSAPAAAPGGPVTRQDPSSASAQDAARARAAYAPVEQGLQSAASSTLVGGAASRPGPTTVTVSTPGDGSSSTFSSATSSVTGFFSNMFGGGKPSAAANPPAAEPAGVTTASTTSAAVEPAVSDWSQSTTVTGRGASAATGPSTHTAAAVVTPEKPAAAHVAAKGKYKIHIAALRSREAAEALAQKLVAEHGADLSNHAPTVDEAVIGSMGTFYRVRVGGYASQEEPQGVCNKLRTSGLDCLVVTN